MWPNYCYHKPIGSVLYCQAVIWTKYLAHGLGHCCFLAVLNQAQFIFVLSYTNLRIIVFRSWSFLLEYSKKQQA